MRCVLPTIICAETISREIMCSYNIQMYDLNMAIKLSTSLFIGINVGVESSVCV